MQYSQPATPKYAYDINIVRVAAKGRWIDIISALAGDVFDQALKNQDYYVPCPLHDPYESEHKFIFQGGTVNECGKAFCRGCRDSLSDGIDLLSYALNKAIPDVCADIGKFLGLQPEFEHVDTCYADEVSVIGMSPKEFRAHVRDQKLFVQGKMDREESYFDMLTLWNKSVCLVQGRKMPKPLRDFFKIQKVLPSNESLARGDSIRFHPKVGYDIDENLEMLTSPCVLYAVRDEHGKILTVQKTFITEKGHLQPFNVTSFMYPSMFTPYGGAIRLMGMPKNDSLFIALSVQSALGIYTNYKHPCWSVLNRDILSSFNPPPGIKTIVVWADNTDDQDCVFAAGELRRRMHNLGVEVVIQISSEPNSQWSEYVHGKFGLFPSFTSVKKWLGV